MKRNVKKSGLEVRKGNLVILNQLFKKLVKYLHVLGIVNVYEYRVSYECGKSAEVDKVDDNIVEVGEVEVFSNLDLVKSLRWSIHCQDIDHSHIVDKRVM